MLFYKSKSMASVISAAATLPSIQERRPFLIYAITIHTEVAAIPEIIFPVAVIIAGNASTESTTCGT